MPTKTQTTPERDGGYTAEAIRADVALLHGDSEFIERWCGKAEAAAFKRILALAERVANARMELVTTYHDNRGKPHGVLFNDIVPTAWIGQRVAIVLLSPERGSSGGDL